MVKLFPKIPLVTPSFNQVEFMEATIQRILSQGYPNIDYIIIEGGSTDVRVERFAHSSDEIMGWRNNDDMYCPWALKIVTSIMSELPQVEPFTTLSPVFWDWQGFSFVF
jgi:glycosyltransferase involved in cell wall biosynthesis